MKWATHGVLLLNTCLTVEEGQAGQPCGRGWEVLTDAVIRHVSSGERPVVFMLWGAHAQSKRALIDTKSSQNTGGQPSFAVCRPCARPPPFIGCGHFGEGAPGVKQKPGVGGKKGPDFVRKSKALGNERPVEAACDRPAPAILKPCYIPRFAGEVAEWLMAADCKSALLRVRWFESSPLHQRKKWISGRALGCECCGSRWVSTMRE